MDKRIRRGGIIVRRKSFSACGFTLLELLVVMVIIGLLASYVGPRLFGEIGKSETKVARAQIDAFSKALASYRLDTGHFPSTELGLKALVVKPEGEPKWQGPYLAKDVPQDPWGRDYLYKSPGDAGRDYDIITFGKDGRPGGDNENTDVTSWQ
jgi:general secretion pathway protein G